MKKLYLSLLCTVLSFPVLFAQIYVTETGAGNKDGSSWANAYEGTKLQQAINEAATATEKQVWVAKGIYKPTEKLSELIYTDGTGTTTVASSDRDMAFILKAGVEIYGGFTGTETSVNDRVFPSYTTTPPDPLAPHPNETILSGDLGILNDNSDNAYHVVSARDHADGAILDGFTIRDSNGDSGDYAEIDGGLRIRRNWGGGISVFTERTMTFKNLIIKNNKSASGGAASVRVNNSGAKFDFENVVFKNNETTGIGGAIYSYAAAGTASLNILNCLLIDNKGASTGGGAIIHSAATGTDYTLNITNSQFKNNETSANFGGALYISSGSVANITSTLFEGNKATVASSGRAGAIYSTGTSTVVSIDDCIFSNNQTTGGVAGHYYLLSGTANITNTRFENGLGSTGAGAIYVNTGDITISSSKFISNYTTTGSAGAIYNLAGALTIDKCEFTSNTTTGSGGALYLTSGSTLNTNVKITNTLFYNNKANSTGTTNGAGAGAIYQSRGGTNPNYTTSTVTVANSTFYANETVNGSAAYSFLSNNQVTISIYNSIFNSNIGGDVRRSSGTGAAVQTYSYNLFQDIINSGSNVTVVSPHYLQISNPQPLFASTTKGDYNFLWPIENSFAIDKGDNTLYTNNVSDVTTAKDFLGNDRLVGSNIDLGAIEWSIVLPVQVSSFTANLVNGRTQLKWDVGTEDNVNRYEIERSQNGTDFTTVATVGANGAASYSTTDNSPALGINYYRLVTVDNDGARKAYDRVQTVTVATLASEGVSVYPNPATGSEVNVGLGNVAVGTYTYKIVSTTGSVAQQGTLSYNGTSAVVSVGSLPAGVYVLQFSNGAQAKLIKQ